jgi:hypothetical protein
VNWCPEAVALIACNDCRRRGALWGNGLSGPSVTRPSSVTGPGDGGAWLACRGQWWLAAEWVGAGPTIRIDDHGWSEFDSSAADGNIPALSVHLLMVHRAQEATIFYAGYAAIDPMPHMVRGAKSGWPIAARETTAAIPGDEGAADTQRRATTAPREPVSRG